MKRRHFIKTGLLASAATASMSLACNRKSDAEVIVLGGGLSGLYAIYLLEQAGKECLLLEGSPRWGGRLYTKKDWPGTPDVGGRGIGDKYTLVKGLIDEFGIEVIDITAGFGSPTALYYEDQLIKTEDWSDLASNPLPETLRSLVPARLEGAAMRQTPALEAIDAWYQKPGLDKPLAELLQKGGLDEAGLQLVNISANYNDIFQTSALNSMHSAAFRKFNGSRRVFNIKDGSSALTDAIAAKLTSPKHLQKKATQILQEAGNVRVQCADGTTYRAKQLICTLPFSTLRDLDLQIPVNPKQGKAIQELGYTKITQIHFRPTEPFWESDEMPIQMWTDSPLERIFDFSKTNDGSQLAAWVNGTGADRFDQMSDKEIADFTFGQMARMRPASEGKLEYIGTHKWGQYEFNKGAYAEFQAGQVGWFSDMIRPAGNVHFAGEHTAKESRGIEGAAESAARVVKELI
ncbi:MAG: FAD-dependent oxidoreductase [Saprospiraceae bacterium]|nr:FAD-dependent oxidoreductase [Saprospiraceae bacterium]